MKEERNDTVEVPLLAVEVGLRELEILIKETEDEDPDPLQDDIFRARQYFEEALEPNYGEVLGLLDYVRVSADNPAEAAIMNAALRIVEEHCEEN